MFNIHILNEEPIDEDGARLGKITVGDFSEEFRCFTGNTFEEMEASWRSELQTLIEGADAVMLIHDPRFAWVLYREGTICFVQQQIYFDGNFGKVKPRRTETENGDRISEWQTSIKSVREYLGVKQACAHQPQPHLPPKKISRKISGGHRIKQCCKSMQEEWSRVCEAHPHPSDCPDQLLAFDKNGTPKGIWIHDGGSSTIQIRYCPWCGKELISNNGG